MGWMSRQSALYNTLFASPQLHSRAKHPSRRTYVAEEQSRDVSADVLQVALRVHVEISGGGEPAVALATTQPVLEDEARDGSAFAHAGCEGGWEVGREGWRD
jgi:hypothetical protein